MKKTILSLLFLSTFFLQAQESDADEMQIKEVSKGACECIAEIDSDQTDVEKNKEIKSCITTHILAEQMNNSLLKQLEQVTDSIEKGKVKDSVSINLDNSNIIVSNKNYEEIEEYLLRNCPALKRLIMISDEEHENSYSDKEKAVEFYNEGIKYYQKGQFEKAVKAYKKAVKKDKKFAFAWDNLGLSYRRLENYKQAIKAYQKSLKLDPNGRVPLMNLPIAQIYLKKYDDAIESYQKFSEVYPDDPEGYYGISRVYLETKQYEKALDNVMKSFIMYKEMESPYHKDAQSIIVILYKAMKEENKIEAFQKIAEKYGINIKE